MDGSYDHVNTILFIIYLFQMKPASHLLGMKPTLGRESVRPLIMMARSQYSSISFALMPLALGCKQLSKIRPIPHCVRRI